MSHIVQIQTQVKDIEAVKAACRRLSIAAPKIGTAHLFTGKRTGIIVELTGWHYPIVIEPDTGTIHFDHYEGEWGNPQELDRFKQAYAIAKATIEARKKGHTVRETRRTNGTVELEVLVKGG